eukprot:TRINITY_DN51662_c0_g1_i1.p1 TRINITY_DN51662_c0_g1~~TRINITY_DN51662_c0_g1_i1.p1  ORF type:complete len:203 (+),score=34.48 TRINITY_DN51662_c0_g1_i1:145-753(+)
MGRKGKRRGPLQVAGYADPSAVAGIAGFDTENAIRHFKKIDISDGKFKDVVVACCSLCREATGSSLELPGPGEGVLICADGLLERSPLEEMPDQRQLLTSSSCVGGSSAFLGFVVVRWVGAGARISALAVASEARRCGHGEALIVRAMAEAEERGCRSVSLHVRGDNLAARSLYEKLAFEFVKKIEDYYEDGESALRLDRVL